MVVVVVVNPKFKIEKEKEPTMQYITHTYRVVELRFPEHGELRENGT
jgi:hypothetical protein